MSPGYGSGGGLIWLSAPELRMESGVRADGRDARTLQDLGVTLRLAIRAVYRVPLEA